MNQTYATLPLSLLGHDTADATANDRDGSVDLADVRQDVAFLTQDGQTPVPWGWFQEGYDREPTDPNLGPTDASGVHASYITHHNGPQYFGYIANNPRLSDNLHGLDNFFQAVKDHTLPSQGGLFYIKGGYQNIFGMKPADQDPAVQKTFLGDDDHPGYSDSQISEALVARAVNAIARSPTGRNAPSSSLGTIRKALMTMSHRRFAPTGRTGSLSPTVPACRCW